MRIFLTLFIVVAFLASCKESHASASSEEEGEVLPLKYAENLTVREFPDFTEVTVRNPVTQLYRYMPESLSPVYVWIFHEAVEDILSGLDQRIKNAILLITVCVFDAETWEKKETLEYCQQPIDAVALAFYCKRVLLGHFDLSKNLRNCLNLIRNFLYNEYCGFLEAFYGCFHRVSSVT